MRTKFDSTIDYFKNPKDYFSPYVKTVLTSYVIPQSDSPGIFGISTHHEPYVLNEIDLDIFVKFTTQKQLKEWLNSYSISAIKLDATIDVTKKYINLCKSLERFCVEQWLEWIHSFSTLVGVIDLDDDDKKELLCQITYTFKFFAKQSPHFATRLFESIHSLVKSLTIVELQDANELLSAILDDSIFQSLYDLHQSLLRNVIQGLSPSLDNESRTNMTNRIFEIADKHSRIKKILIAHDALSLSEHAEFLRESMDMIDSENLFMLLYKKVLTFDQGIEDLFVNRIHAEHTERTNNKGVYPYPDWLVINIEKCLLLKLIGFEINLDRLKSYTNYSTHLEFMLTPEDFDYSKVDLNHYMWQNLLYSPKYQQFFIEQKAEILTEKLHDAFRKRKDTRDQQKIVFGILLDDNELRSY